ncbi:MAG: ATP-dependent RNA helicase HrpA [Actinomycetota bacterium]
MRTAPTPIRYPDDLPIAQRRDELLATIRDNQVVVVAGETGSGKSTQLPKFCLELGRGAEGRIGHTQPRRIAARAVAERVAEELGTELGETVGYAVRFTDRVGDRTMVKVMTDGILLAEIQRDPDLEAYDTLIIDEAHERSLNIDFLLGYLANLLPRRPDLKLIITSATIDTQRFSEHFDDAPIVEVSGRAYPVEVRYQPLATPQGEPISQVDGIVGAVEELFTEGDGDVLVFCSGEREIRDAVEALEETQLPGTEILPLFARLSAAEQHRVFSRARGRRVVVSTNVAETSLTVPGIEYVVDSGTARISRYNRRTKVQRLPIEAISQASANQRSGRCGRIAPGIAIRLYGEEDFDSRPEFTEPEIQRTSLASVILQMTALGLGDVESFPFVDPPDTRSIRDGIALLDELGALRGPDDALELTKLGRRLSRLPIDPRLGRMLLAADTDGCLDEMLVIAAALSIQDPRERPDDAREAAAQSHARFADPDSDFISLLNLWRYLGEQRDAMGSSAFRRMCRREYLHYLRIREWQDLHSQLRRVGRDLKLRRNESPAGADAIHRALLTGLLSQVGALDAKDLAKRRAAEKGRRRGRREQAEYRGARGAKFAIGPGSALARKTPKWVMAAELVETNRMWARTVARIRPEWIEQAADHVVTRTYTDPRWDRERGAAVATEAVSLYGIPLVNSRTVLWGRIDPEDARDLFIRHALIEGDWDTDHDFAVANRAQLDEVAALEAKSRRDLLVGVEARVDFFDQRLPDDIVSTRHFDSWWKQAHHKTPDLLTYELPDLLRHGAVDADEAAFPTTWPLGDVELRLDYEFDPASASDGLTIDIPVGILGRIDPAPFDWLVPGLRRDLLEGIVRNLPKAIRRTFVPIPGTVDDLVGELEPAEDLAETVRGMLARRGSIEIPPGTIDLDGLPLHLRPNFRVIDDQGQALAVGGDLDALRALLDDQVRNALDASAHDLERTGLTSWSFGEIPREVEIEGSGHSVTAYPSLVDEDDSVSLRLLPSRAEQRASMWAGTRRLLVLNRPGVSKPLRALLTNEVKLALLKSPYESPTDWMDDLVASAVDDIMLERDAPAWTATAWDRLLHHVRDDLPKRIGRLGAISADILRDLDRVEARLATRTDDKFAVSVSDVRYQLDGLVYPGFLTAVGARNLPKIRRYVEAAAHRVERLPEDPQRDADKTRRVHALDRQHDSLVDQLGLTPALEDVLWQLQELRVSLFAQHVGTDGPVSEQRIRRALDDAARPR